MSSRFAFVSCLPMTFEAALSRCRLAPRRVGRRIFLFCRRRQIIEMLPPGHVAAEHVRETVDVREPIARGIAQNMRRLFAGVELLYTGEKKPAHGDDGLVADAEMLPAAVEDRAHAFRGARVMIEKILDAGEIYLFLYLAVLEIIITRGTNPGVVGVDLFAPVHLVVEHGAVAAKADIVAPAVRVVGRH